MVSTEKSAQQREVRHTQRKAGRGEVPKIASNSRRQVNKKLNVLLFFLDSLRSTETSASREQNEVRVDEEFDLPNRFNSDLKHIKSYIVALLGSTAFCQRRSCSRNATKTGCWFLAVAHTRISHFRESDFQLLADGQSLSKLRPLNRWIREPSTRLRHSYSVLGYQLNTKI